jgi:hypothetical protein
MRIQSDKVIFILEPSDQARAAIAKRPTVVDHPDGQLSIGYNGVELAYGTFDKIRQVDPRCHCRQQAAGTTVERPPR